MTEFEKQMEVFHKIDKEFDEIIHNSFQGLFLDGHGNGGPNFHATITDHNKLFENTEYFYNGALEFVHLTSIPNLFSILNSRAFRLYNNHSSADPLEYNYAADLLKLSPNEIEHCKEYLYTFSFCPLSELNNQKVWSVYGKDFTGAGITFKIINDPKEWENFHMAKVIYDDHRKFQTYFDNIKALESKYQITAKCDLSKLIGFHKTPKWSDEKEVRITTYFPYQHMDEYFKYSKTEFRIEPNRNRITHYIELPIWVDNNSYLIKGFKKDLDRTQDIPVEYFANRPKIQITGIILGKNCGLEPDNMGRYTYALRNIVSNNYGYEISVVDDLFSM